MIISFRFWNQFAALPERRFAAEGSPPARREEEGHDDVVLEPDLPAVGKRNDRQPGVSPPRGRPETPSTAD
jgi:hypothetical protein